MRWIVAFTVSAVGLALWFLILRACLQLWVSFEAIVILALPWIFVLLILGLRGWKRAVIPLLLVAAGIISLMPYFNPMPIAATESRAVLALVRIRLALEGHRSGSVDAVIGDVLSKQDFQLQRFYQF